MFEKYSLWMTTTIAIMAIMAQTPYACPIDELTSTPCPSCNLVGQKCGVYAPPGSCDGNPCCKGLNCSGIDPNLPDSGGVCQVIIN